MLRVKFPAGILLEEAVERLIKIAQGEHGTVVANINDIDIFVEPESCSKDLIRYLRKMHEIYDYLLENELDTSILTTEEYLIHENEEEKICS